MKIGIVIGSIREKRFGEQVGNWAAEQAAARDDAEYEVIDLRSFNVPLFTSATHPAMARGEYGSPEVNAWAEAIRGCDGLVFVTPEYNFSLPGGFKNAFDSIAEWRGKPIAFISYGSAGGHRAVVAWRSSVAVFGMHDIRPQVALIAGVDFHRGQAFEASEARNRDLDALFTELVATGKRLAG